MRRRKLGAVDVEYKRRVFAERDAKAPPPPPILLAPSQAIHTRLVRP